MHDVGPGLYTTVLREMIRHENEVTNHRIMWLLIAQGLIANAYVGAQANLAVATSLAAVGVLITLSTFFILYKSYQARGYLEFLGNEAKAGRLQEAQLPLLGWPRRRIRGWRRGFWANPCLGKPGDLLEPYLFLPALVTVAWANVLVRRWLPLDRPFSGALSLVLSILLLGACSVIWVRRAELGETESVDPPA